MPAINTPEEFAAEIKRDRAAAKRVVKTAGLSRSRSHALAAERERAFCVCTGAASPHASFIALLLHVRAQHRVDAPLIA